MADTIDYNSANRVANKLRRMARNTPSVTDSAMKAHAQRMRRILKGTPYVPRMRNQRYKRTGNLANRWRVVKVRSGRYSVINGAAYSGFVVGKLAEKAFMHKDPMRSMRGSRPWWVAADEVKQYNKGLTETITGQLIAEFEK